MPEPSKAFQTMKSPAVVIFLLLCLTSNSAPVVAADDIFATPASTPTMVDRYPTVAAFLAATRSGEIPEMLRDKDQNATWVSIGPPLINIMTKEYGLDIKSVYPEPLGISLGLMIKNLTDHAFDTQDENPVAAFQNNQRDMPAALRDKFNKFAVQYSKAVKEYVTSKHQLEERHQRELAEQQQQDVLKDKQAAVERRRQDEQANEERRKQKELMDARQASQNAEDDIKAAAMRDALAKTKEARQKRLAEVLASPAYKQWEAALVVQQGEEMISNAQRVLDHDDAVKRESGVTDLAARRAAGEQMVAGKSLVETAFGEYKKLGGKAATPKEVVAGPDPAADYR